MTNVSLTPDVVAREISDFYEALFVDLEDLRTQLLEVFASGPVDSATANQIVHPIAQRLLDRGLLGGGYVAARGALTDHALYLAWWQGERQQLLGQSDDSVSGDPLDYTRKEWFRVPEATGERHVTGPYVDYVCTDEYVVTSSLPVLVGDRMLGIVGADMLVETLEDRLAPRLRGTGISLVSAAGRVIVSDDHRLAPGSLVDLEECAVRLECGTFPLLVVTR